MTVRPIEPINTAGIEPARPATGSPIFETVDPRSLFVDPAYQRNLSERSVRQIRRIVEGFDWTRFKPPVCAFSEGDDGASILKVIDGQHTAIAAASNPHVPMIPIMIVEAPDVRSQASAFIGQNLDRLGITKTQMHVASVATGDEDALALERVCGKAGVRVLRHPPSGGSGYQPGDTVAVAAIDALVKRDGEDHAGLILAILAGAALAPIKADHVKAVDLLLTDSQFGSVDPDALPAHIQAQGEAGMKEARVFASTHGIPLWRALASVWFQKAKKRREAPSSAGKGREEASPNAELRRDERPARGAWAPGNHVRRCAKCDRRFRGDRLTAECADCSYGAADV